MARAKTVQVRAKVAHTQPGSQVYRNQGDVFAHTGELYKHVEPSSRVVEERDDLLEVEETGDEE